MPRDFASQYRTRQILDMLRHAVEQRLETRVLAQRVEIVVVLYPLPVSEADVD